MEDNEKTGRYFMILINSVVLVGCIVGAIIVPDFNDKLTCIAFMAYAAYVVLDCLEHVGIIKRNKNE